MASAQPMTDHDQIRQWAEERGARPACVKGTGRQRGDTGMIRLDFPGYSGGDSLQPISWNEWFRQFDENNLALLVQETTRGGQKSNFNKLVSRPGANGRTQSRRAAGNRQASSAGTTRRHTVVLRRAAGAGARKSSARKTARKSTARGAARKNTRGASRSRASTRGRSTRSR